MSFQLSNLVIDGLKSLNTTINTESTKKLISNTIKNTLSSDVSSKLIVKKLSGINFDEIVLCLNS